ncbi:Drug/metabolite transporter [Corchorus olitorius]|uniref:WAT1-related protein n=1 Tax=Corchorus olitorius TaxID=93759 RepID=A0A1R3KU90_9ROSI|nr:Drug/metabolite transporter [Corchorus olitorius]
MIVVELSNVVVNILFKAASSKGLSYNIFIAYGYVLAALVLLPLAFFFNGKTMVPPLKLPFISRLCFLGLIGYSGLVCAFKGVEYASPTLASAISNLTPAFTFILAVLFRLISSFSFSFIVLFLFLLLHKAP